MMTKKLLLLGVLLSTHIFALVLPLRCVTFGDKLDSVQAVGRKDWASKCFPSQRPMINLHDKILDSAGTPGVEGFPIFGYIDAEYNVVNPENWFAPVDGDADCNVPEGYELVAYCGVIEN